MSHAVGNMGSSFKITLISYIISKGSEFTKEGSVGLTEDGEIKKEIFVGFT